MQSPKLILSLFLAFLSYKQVFGQSMPKYAAMVGGKECGQIRREEFLAQQGVGGMRFIAGNHWERIPIDSFSIIIIRDTAVIVQIKNKGQIFTSNTKAQISKMVANDRVLIYDIYGRDYDDKVVSVRPIELIIEQVGFLAESHLSAIISTLKLVAASLNTHRLNWMKVANYRLQRISHTASIYSPKRFKIYGLVLAGSHQIYQ